MQQKTKIEKARTRNWAKARIIGMTTGYIGSVILTNEEVDTLKHIERLKMHLLDNWDENSKKLGMNVKPKKEKF